MGKIFNVNGTCIPELHYMVDISDRLRQIKAMVDAGQYFTINRARQYGKTTTLAALGEFLKEDYEVISLDFQMMSYGDFESEESFVKAFARIILLLHADISEAVKESLRILSAGKAEAATLLALFECLLVWCRESEKKLVLLIDEVDSATNNQVFLDFLAQLRAYYLRRNQVTTFQSVILAGVYDVKNIKRKIRPEDEHRTNSPWNIAADFFVDMSFSARDIAGMLADYENDYRTGMDLDAMAGLLYDYTSGYPFLVSRLCKLMDERIVGNSAFPDKSSVWTKAGFLEAERMLLNERNTLFESLANKLTDYPELRTLLYDLLFTGREISYNPLNRSIEIAEMFGFIRNEGGKAVVSNRIFDTLLYNLFISEEYVSSQMYDAGERDKNQFVVGGHLDVRRVLEKFVEAFDCLYGDQDLAFLEKDGRKYFMLFLKPIINGTGNCYVEAQTRNRERMDLVIDYRGEQSVIELKIWRGSAYHERGEAQLADYLDYYHLKKGYMLSFNFNKQKEIGVKEIVLGDKVLVEAVV